MQYLEKKERESGGAGDMLQRDVALGRKLHPVDALIEGLVQEAAWVQGSDMGDGRKVGINENVTVKIDASSQSKSGATSSSSSVGAAFGIPLPGILSVLDEPSFRSTCLSVLQSER